MYKGIDAKSEILCRKNAWHEIRACIWSSCRWVGNARRALREYPRDEHVSTSIDCWRISHIFKWLCHIMHTSDGSAHHHHLNFNYNYIRAQLAMHACSVSGSGVKYRKSLFVFFLLSLLLNLKCLNVCRDAVVCVLHFKLSTVCMMSLDGQFIFISGKFPRRRTPSLWEHIKGVIMNGFKVIKLCITDF